MVELLPESMEFSYNLVFIFWAVEFNVVCVNLVALEECNNTSCLYGLFLDE